MIDLSDLTLVIPFKYDTEDRLENLRFLVNYYKTHFTGVKFVILEEAPEQKGVEFDNIEGVTYIFKKENGFMHRTRMLNDGAKIATTKFISAHDTDVFFKPNDILRTLESLRMGNNYVLPFNGIFLDVSGKAKKQVIETLDSEFLPMVPHLIQRGNTVHGDGVRCVVNNSVGGALFYNRERYLELGGYNEKFISWGYEDNEINHRFKMMGDAMVKISNSNCYHLNHRRGKDSQMVHDYTEQNKKELSRVKSMKLDALKTYINNELVNN